MYPWICFTNEIGKQILGGMSMKRINKTANNLRTVWNQLDNASGELYNALHNLSQMTDITGQMKRQMDMIDVSRIDMLKQELEAIMESKGIDINEQD
ncbi:hypothetical protein PQE72_gp055 [Bacillus phage vB_BanS_Skywalker]|uniref:Uncharacterized protein n=2 Tax=Tsamsavirus TaxID=3044849 RepID=A0AAE8YV62_9CAUD|nr:hypothetical protein PQE72_gp055 [Bacillus phage vB_BanS_Skywalker]YP_010680923.1 hypothetical protein PQE73_gp027 [Bacillus phage vB_BanS_MrDarsey]UGO47859.1 hypothetical protein MRDARSEY_27 [Bacillus phage vB_BanS_MrDarsey]UGO51388.1 hypothetical protein SKYWALKER_231 [Bacillus phage vB_BanS_Skywalker]